MDRDTRLLAVDIGNTSIHVGAFTGRRLVRRLSLPTSLAASPRLLRQALRRFAGAEQAMVCSVVPSVTPKVAAALREAGLRARVVGRDVSVPLTNRYRHPSQVGQDRLVGAFAAVQEFQQHCIVCDFGTAVTIDVVRAFRRRTRHSQPATRHSVVGEYLGGIIAPGLELSLETLAERTALLPRVDLREPAELLGRDTATSIRSGIVHGCAALCDGLVARLKATHAPGAVVVATGGAAPLIAKYARSIRVLRPDLVLQGLRHITVRFL
jgi:type III pantothenate kinase